MEPDNSAAQYYVWGVDEAAYGPIELPDLVHWVKDERVTADTWIFAGEARRWTKAAQVTELKMFFRARTPNVEGIVDVTSNGDVELKPGVLRHIKILAEMDDAQLRKFSEYVETVRLGPFTHFVKRGDPGEALYGVIEGEMRTSILIEGHECPVATLQPGAVFGEIALLDGGVHTADVFSNRESLLLKFSIEAFQKLVQEAPETALGFMLGLSKAVAGRVRTLTRRFEETQLAQFADHAQKAA